MATSQRYAVGSCQRGTLFSVALWICRLAFTVLFLCCGLSVSAGTAADAGSDGSHYRYHIGISVNAFGKVNSNDAVAALKVWALTVQKEQQLQGSISTSLVTGTSEQLGAEFRRGTYDGVGLTVDEYLRSGIRSPDVYLGKRGDSPMLRYVIVGPVGSGKGKQADGKQPAPPLLAGLKLVSCEGNEMAMALPWLTTLVAEQSPGRVVRPVLLENISKAILQVFFAQAGGALVTEEGYELACELNPQIRKKTRVLYRSPPFVTVFFVFQPERNARIMELERAVQKIHTTPGGKQVLTVIQSSSLDQYPASALDPTIALLRRYYKLIGVADPQP